LPRV